MSLTLGARPVDMMARSTRVAGRTTAAAHPPLTGPAMMLEVVATTRRRPRRQGAIPRHVPCKANDRLLSARGLTLISMVMPFLAPLVILRRRGRLNLTRTTTMTTPAVRARARLVALSGALQPRTPALLLTDLALVALSSSDLPQGMSLVIAVPSAALIVPTPLTKVI